MIYLTVIFLLTLSIFYLIAKDVKSFNIIVFNLVKKENTDTFESGPPLGAIAPNFNLTSSTNNKVTLEDLLIKPTALLIVNTKCDICSRDVKEFQEASTRYQAINFIIIVSGPRDLLAYEQNNTEPKILFADEQFIENYSIKGFPTFLFITKNKKIVAQPIFVKDFFPIFNHYRLSENP
ncbi:TlpA family protein disulfide reductase [Peribacillus simplex]|uniref:TlpA family protein disulfide reductase n=1 Tax=Peribacillus simplex TaxID=1478 RepID=UPI003CF7C4D4